MYINHRGAWDTLLNVADALFGDAGGCRVEHRKDGRLALVFEVGEGDPTQTKTDDDGRGHIVEVEDDNLKWMGMLLGYGASTHPELSPYIHERIQTLRDEIKLNRTGIASMRDVGCQYMIMELQALLKALDIA